MMSLKGSLIGIFVLLAIVTICLAVALTTAAKVEHNAASEDTLAYNIQTDDFSATLSLFGNGYYKLSYAWMAAHTSYGTYEVRDNDLVLKQTIAAGSDCAVWKENNTYTLKIDKEENEIKNVYLSKNLFNVDETYKLEKTRYALKGTETILTDTCSGVDREHLKDAEVYYDMSYDTVLVIFPDIGYWLYNTTSLKGGQLSVGTYSVNNQVIMNELAVADASGDSISSKNTYTLLLTDQSDAVYGEKYQIKIGNKVIDLYKTDPSLLVSMVFHDISIGKYVKNEKLFSNLKEL